jgi:hypothetical protein
MFGLREKGERSREIGTREIGEKQGISSVWNT